MGDTQKWLDKICQIALCMSMSIVLCTYYSTSTKLSLCTRVSECAEQVNTSEGCPKIDLFAFKGHDRVLHIGWSYGVGPKVSLRLFWIAYDCTLSGLLT